MTDTTPIPSSYDLAGSILAPYGLQAATHTRMRLAACIDRLGVDLSREIVARTYLSMDRYVRIEAAALW